MSVIEFLQKQITKSGLSFAELGRRLDIPHRHLYDSLGPKPTRILRAHETLVLIQYFSLSAAEILEACKNENTDK